MNLIDYTTNWIKGELFEARLIVAFGILTITAGFLFWKIGTTPNAKALLIPLLVVGTIYSAIGGGMLYSNPKRMIELPQKYERDKIEFTKSEKKRVDDFQYGYKVSKIVATIFFYTDIDYFLDNQKPDLDGNRYRTDLFCFSWIGYRLFFTGKSSYILLANFKGNRKMKPIINIKSISDINNFVQHRTSHPLVTVIDFSKMDEIMEEGTRVSCDFYSIMFKNYCANNMKYGRQSYDFQEGSLVCIAPKQVVTMDTEIEKKRRYDGMGTVLSSRSVTWYLFGYKDERLYLFLLRNFRSFAYVRQGKGNSVRLHSEN